MKITNFKMRVTPEQSRIVQQTLFNNGYKKYYGDEIYIPKEPETFIYLNKDGNFTANNSDKNYFTYNILPELTFQEFFDRYVKWCVKVTDENYNTLEHWVMNRIDFDTSHVPIQCYIISDKLDGSYQKWTNYVPEGYIEITFEQFKQYVLKTKEDKIMKKKIIGYKVPFELFNGEVKIGFIYKPLASINNKYYAPINLEGKVGLPHLNLPKEIVEQWEPVYEETSKELYFGKVKFTIKKGDDFATTEYGKVTKKEIDIAIDYIENPPKLNKYFLSIKTLSSSEERFDKLDGTYLTYAFGCQSGTLEQLKEIYNAFE